MPTTAHRAGRRRFRSQPSACRFAGSTWWASTGAPGFLAEYLESGTREGWGDSGGALHGGGNPVLLDAEVMHNMERRGLQHRARDNGGQ